MKKEIDFGKRMAFGCLRLPIVGGDYDLKAMEEKGQDWMNVPGSRANEENVDEEAWQKIVDKGMANGYNYFDTSFFYHGGNSERAIGHCVADKYPRDSFILSNKMPIKFMQSGEDMEGIFNEQLERCHVDYFDFYLIHALSAETYEKWGNEGLFEFLSQKRAEGKFREFGASMHETPEFLDRVLTEHPEIDFVMLQINYLDWNSPAQRSRELYEVAVKHEKPIVVMEPCKGGTLANPPEEAAKLMKEYNPDASYASWAYRFVGSLPGVRVVSIGMPRMEFLEDNMKTFDNFEPLNDEEYAILDKVVDIINEKTAIACTNCNYCVEACPLDIPAGTFFLLYNDFYRQNAGTEYNEVCTSAQMYSFMIERINGADKCIKCGKCEKVCPQHLPIPELLETKIADELYSHSPDGAIKKGMAAMEAEAAAEAEA